MQRQVNPISHQEIQVAIDFIQERVQSTICALDLAFHFNHDGNKLNKLNFVDKNGKSKASYKSSPSYYHYSLVPDSIFVLPIANKLMLEYRFNKIGVNVIERCNVLLKNGFDITELEYSPSYSFLESFLYTVEVQLIYNFYTDVFEAENGIKKYNLQLQSCPNDKDYRVKTVIKLLDNLESYFLNNPEKFSRKRIEIKNLFDYFSH